ncbi:hypothetical protein [Nocardioides gilvus]|uniref:hypothetical protein n=1 Tax=Nocardioides gilvus TaxID=1735589 RepID=UPI000D747056|nr:hypothetical protein [Nocardioides gilvus]
MTPDPLLSSWIVEALGAAGRTASPLTVAKEVWSRHEQELKSAGDLLFTWQLDLRATAKDMVADGTLSLDEGGDWRLSPGVSAPPSARRTWSEHEVEVAVDGYLSMLKSEMEGLPLRRAQVLAEVLANTSRTADQVDAMMSNISAVVQEHGLTPLTAFRPRSNVPAGVRPVVAAALEL